MFTHILHLIASNPVVQSVTAIIVAHPPESFVAILVGLVIIRIGWHFAFPVRSNYERKARRPNSND